MKWLHTCDHQAPRHVLASSNVQPLFINHYSPTPSACCRSILAPPGHGKSAFLKALCQALPQGKKKGVQGSITYSGVGPEEANKTGVNLGAMVRD